MVRRVHPSGQNESHDPTLAPREAGKSASWVLRNWKMNQPLGTHSMALSCLPGSRLCALLHQELVQEILDPAFDICMNFCEF